MRKTLYSTILIVSALLTTASCNSTETTSSTSEYSSVIDSQDDTSSSIVSKNNTYSNPTHPIVDGEKVETYMADPYVIRGEDDYFYLYCTQTDVYRTDIASGRKFTRGPVFKSNNCVDWVYEADVFENYTPEWGTVGAGVWAPTVAKIGDYYNFYYSLSTGGDNNPGIGVARSTTPYGPFEHYGKLFNSEEIGVTNSIDPHVFIDNNKVYMGFGSYGGLITLVELTDDGLELKGGLEYQKENKVPIAGYETYDMNNYEATLIFKRDGYYYLFLSTGTCCSGVESSYHVVVARSTSLFGPYENEKGKGMFYPKSGEYVVTPSLSSAMGVGHNGLIVDDVGDVWMIYHGYDTTSSKSNWRVTYMDKLLWGENGFPYIENRRASNHTELPGPYIYKLENV